MSTKTKKQRTQNTQPVNFGMFRLSKSKETVDICPNTLRAYNREGLAFYRRGKAVFVSMAELEEFIRRTGGQQN